MVAFALTLEELHFLLVKENKYVLHPMLGVVPPPDPEPHIAREILKEAEERLYAREEFTPENFEFVKQILDYTDVEMHLNTIRPFDPMPEINIEALPKEFIEAGAHHSIPTQRVIKSVIGRAQNYYFTFIRDGGLFFFITEEVNSPKIDQIYPLLYHSISQEEPYKFDPININTEIAFSLANVQSISPTPENGVTAHDARIFNELLQAKNTQKTSLTVHAKSFSKEVVSPLAIGILDFEGLGRVISKPYDTFDGTSWLRYVPGTERELGKALNEAFQTMGINWFEHTK